MNVWFLELQKKGQVNFINLIKVSTEKRMYAYRNICNRALSAFNFSHPFMVNTAINWGKMDSFVRSTNIIHIYLSLFPLTVKQKEK